jgi:hypothetical protein
MFPKRSGTRTEGTVVSRFSWVDVATEGQIGQRPPQIDMRNAGECEREAIGLPCRQRPGARTNVDVSEEDWHVLSRSPHRR